MIVTHIDAVYRCDTFFPEIDPAVWTVTAREEHRSGDGVAYAFVTYERKS
jgi:dihydrofolate reductase